MEDSHEFKEFTNKYDFNEHSSKYSLNSNSGDKENKEKNENKDIKEDEKKVNTNLATPQKSKTTIVTSPTQSLTQESLLQESVISVVATKIVEKISTLQETKDSIDNDSALDKKRKKNLKKKLRKKMKKAYEELNECNESMLDGQSVQENPLENTIEKELNLDSIDLPSAIHSHTKEHHTDTLKNVDLNINLHNRSTNSIQQSNNNSLKKNSHKKEEHYRENDKENNSHTKNAKNKFISMKDKKIKE